MKVKMLRFFSPQKPRGKLGAGSNQNMNPNSKYRRDQKSSPNIRATSTTTAAVTVMCVVGLSVSALDCDDRTASQTNNTAYGAHTQGLFAFIRLEDKARYQSRCTLGVVCDSPGGGVTLTGSGATCGPSRSSLGRFSAGAPGGTSALASCRSCHGQPGEKMSGTGSGEPEAGCGAPA